MFKKYMYVVPVSCRSLSHCCLSLIVPYRSLSFLIPLLLVPLSFLIPLLLVPQYWF